MDTQGLLPAPTRQRRRRHSPEFKEQVVTASLEPGNSIAGVAQQFNVNANLVHKWRRQLGPRDDGFVKVALPSQSPTALPEVATSSAERGTVRVEVTSAVGPVVLHWPLDQPHELAHWLRALQP